MSELRDRAYKLRNEHRGNCVYFRGLIEISNICKKNCLYCGIRCANKNVQRYELSDEQVIKEAKFAIDAGYGSIVIQGGERSDRNFVERITRLLYQIKKLPMPSGSQELGITLSLGEWSKEVYKQWYEAGATRYLLRIESSNKDLYEKIHPCKNSVEYWKNSLPEFRDLAAAGVPVDSLQKSGAQESNPQKSGAQESNPQEIGAQESNPQKIGAQESNPQKFGAQEYHGRFSEFESRLQALYDLKSVGYLLGTGVMIGLPFQTYGILDDDLRFFKDLGADMIGMGPYIPHKDTPLGQLVLKWRAEASAATKINLEASAATKINLEASAATKTNLEASAATKINLKASAATLANQSGNKGVSGNYGNAEAPEYFENIVAGSNPSDVCLQELYPLDRGDFWNLSNDELLNVCLDMVAKLRVLMPHINIAATTALQVLNEQGREMALLSGANVIMPNITDISVKNSYNLYEGKPGLCDDAVSTKVKLLDNLRKMGIEVGWNKRGDWR